MVLTVYMTFSKQCCWMKKYIFRELLDKVKSWEDSELSGQQVGERPSLSPLKRSKLSPLTSAEGGPAQLLRAQVWKKSCPFKLKKIIN